MNCSRFEAVLSDYADGLLQGPLLKATAEHEASCPGCCGLLAQVTEVRAQLEDFPQVIPPAGLVDRILEKTTGKPKKRSLWQDLLLPTLGPFLSQRFALATVMLFFFLSFMVQLAGPPVRAVLAPTQLADRADRFSSQVSKVWAEVANFRESALTELGFLKEDLLGRLDYHLLLLALENYDQSVQEHEQESQGPETSGDVGEAPQYEEES